MQSYTGRIQPQELQAPSYQQAESPPVPKYIWVSRKEDTNSCNRCYRETSNYSHEHKKLILQTMPHNVCVVFMYLLTAVVIIITFSA